MRPKFLERKKGGRVVRNRVHKWGWPKRSATRSSVSSIRATGAALEVLRLLSSAGCSGMGFRVAFSLCPLPPALSGPTSVGRGWPPAVCPEGPDFLQGRGHHFPKRVKFINCMGRESTHVKLAPMGTE